MFSALIGLYGRDVTEAALTVPGGRLGTQVVGGPGSLITVTSLALALVPDKDVVDVGRFYQAVFGSLTLNLLTGVALYVWGRRNRGVVSHLPAPTGTAGG